MGWLKLWLKAEVETDRFSTLKYFKRTLFQEEYSPIYHIGVQVSF